jgi:two-component system, chemotaxis family, protein-glutamate methylesterase/glutaminase
VRCLPADFHAAIFVVVHFPGSVTSALPRILTRAGVLPATHPDNESPIHPGRIYVAPPDCHLFIEEGNVRLSRGPKENGHRPAIDPLFRSAAHHYGSRVIGILLSGNLSDGTAGLVSIKQRSGIAIVQDPETALYSGMPRSAIERVPVDHVVPVKEMAGLLEQLTAEPAPSRKDIAVKSSRDEDDTLDEVAIEHRKTQAGIPSTMSCPECHGVLWEDRDGDVLAFRCRVGHAFTEEALLAIQAEQLRGKVTAASVLEHDLHS